MNITITSIIITERQTRSLVLIPQVAIPVPSCGGSNRSDPVWYIQTSNAPQATYPPFQETGANCTEGSFESCNNNEMCVGAKCWCRPNYKQNSKKTCVPMGDKEEPATASNNVWPIVGSVIAGAVVIGALLIMIIYKYRRYQQRYGQHELLIANASDASEFDNPDPPMLEA